MNVAAPELIREALDLPEEAQADLAHRLLESRPSDRQIQPVIKIFKLGEEPKEREYWLTQTLEARWAAVEEIRREYHGWEVGAEPRLQRVLTVAKR